MDRKLSPEIWIMIANLLKPSRRDLLRLATSSQYLLDTLQHLAYRIVHLDLSTESSLLTLNLLKKRSGLASSIEVFKFQNLADEDKNVSLANAFACEPQSSRSVMTPGERRRGQGRG